MTPVSLIANPAIDFYQRFVSPRKGFQCPYRLLHGGDSCSERIRSIIQRHGLDLARIRRQFRECRAAAVVLAFRSKQAKDRPHSWLSYLDACQILECDAFDITDSCEPLSNCGSVPDCDCCPW